VAVDEMDRGKGGKLAQGEVEIASNRVYLRRNRGQSRALRGGDRHERYDFATSLHLSEPTCVGRAEVNSASVHFESTFQPR